MEHLKKLMEKKMKKEGHNPMDAGHKAAKMAALKALHEDMKGEMRGGLGSHLEDLKKVSVMAPDKEHLEKGLEAAKGMVSNMPENMDGEEEGSESESPEMESSEQPEEQPEMESQEHETKEENEIADLKREIEELKQLILQRR